MRIRTNHDLGWFALRHDGYKAAGYSLDLRACMVGLTITGDRQKPLGRWTVKKGDYGDLNGALRWATAGKDKRPIGSFFFGGVPAVIADAAVAPPDTPTKEGTNPPPADDEHKQAGNPFPPSGPSKKPTNAPKDNGKGANATAGNPTKPGQDAQGQKPGQPAPTKIMAFPIRDKSWSADTRYAPLEVHPPGSAQGEPLRSYAAGTRGIVFAGTEEDQQESVFVALGSDLVAVNNAGSPTAGTLVYDLEWGDKLDLKRSARLQSIMRVVKGPAWRIGGKRRKFANVLGFNLGDMTGQLDSPAGLFVSKVEGGLGVLTHWPNSYQGGPFRADARGCQHLIEGGDDGWNIPLHLHTNSLWGGGRTRAVKSDYIPEGQGDELDMDGPLDFTDVEYKAEQAMHPVPCHLCFDKKRTHRLPGIDKAFKGIWAWQAYCHMYKVTATPPGGPGQPPVPPPKIPEKPGQPQPPPPTIDPPSEDPPFGFLIPGSLRYRPFTEDYTGDVLGPGDTGLIEVADPTGVPLSPPAGETNQPGAGAGGKGAPMPPGIEVPSSGRGREDNTYALDPNQAGRPSVYERPWWQPRDMSAVSNELSMPALSFRPQLWRRGAPWLTNWMPPSAEALREYDLQSPVVLRAEAYGAQGGTVAEDVLDGDGSGTLAGEPFVYLVRPQNGRSGTPYPGGLANGGICFLTGFQSLADIDFDLDQPGNPGGTSYVTLPPRVCLGLGLPDLTNGSIRTGYALGVDSSGNVTFTRVSSAGAEVSQLQLDSSGNLVMLPKSASAGATMELRLRELAANGTNYIGVKAPDAITTNSVLILPSDVPAAGDVLTVTSVSGGNPTLNWTPAAPATGISTLYATAVQTATTAVVTEETLQTYTIPAATMSADGDAVIVKAWGSFAANANVKTIRLRLGAAGTVLATNDITPSPNGGSWSIEAKIMYRNGVVQTNVAQATVGAVAQSVASTPTNNNAAGTIAVGVTGQNGTASAGDIICDGIEVESAPA